MAYPAYVREKARELRTERRLSIVEIADRLGLPKTTIFYWVRDIPLQRPRRANPHSGSRAMQRKFRLLRERAYEDGRDSFEQLCASDPTFRDFVCMYIGEGFKRNRNRARIRILGGCARAGHRRSGPTRATSGCSERATADASGAGIGGAGTGC
jgi:hypothetical protein